ncbi:MAG: hypothetical protein U5K77_00520 [Candidatus Saccharibacteria bacterium]|nr:hypothetical protein [Candidatus Saccharibacteria bacterium]
MLVDFGMTKNGEQVYMNPADSHAPTHFEATPGLEELVREALSTIEATGEEVPVQLDLGIVIGKTECVKVDESDEIVYAIREGRDTYTKFVKNRDPEPTNHLSIVLRKEGDTYKLWSAWIGELGEPFPDSEAATDKSKEYWSNRALIFGIQQIKPGTETTNCPWENSCNR